jgi:hypothetical protein
MDTTKLVLGCVAAGVSVNLYGDVGTGKSSIIRRIGEFLGRKVVTKSLTRMNETDFSGIQYLSEEYGYEYDREGNLVVGPDGKPKMVRLVKSSPMPFVRDMLEDPNSILFLDEMNRASEAIQGCALTLILDGDSGDTKIKPSVWRCSAINFDDLGANKFGKAVANRFCHLKHDVDVEVVSKGVITGFMEVDQPIVNSAEEVLRNRVKYRTLWAQFIVENPTLAKKTPQYIEVEDDLTFPTPRSWEFAREILTYLDKNDHDYLMTLVTGCVGKEAARLFLRFIESNKDSVIDLTKYLGKEDDFVLPNPDRPDEVQQIFQNMEYWFNMEPKKWFKMWKRLIQLLHNDKKRFGKYTNYDNVIKIYWNDNFMKVLRFCFEGDIKKKRALTEAMREELDGVYEIMTVPSSI